MSQPVLIWRRPATRAWGAARISGLCFGCLAFSRNHILLWSCPHKAGSKIQHREIQDCKSPLSLEHQKACSPLRIGAPGNFPSSLRAEMETRTFAVECYLCFSESFLSLSSRFVHPATFVLLTQGITGPSLCECGPEFSSPRVWAEASLVRPRLMEVFPETSSSVIEPQL